jgi:hypothetical protein
MAAGWAPARERVSRSNATGKRRADEAGCRLDRSLGTDEIVDKLRQRAILAGYRCYLCGVSVTNDDQWHLDHYHPLALGGGHVLENLEMACRRCNLFKGHLPIARFLERKGWDGIQPVFPVLRLSDRPLEELWRIDRYLATKFARRPREVPPAKPWTPPTTAGEQAIVAVLTQPGRDPYRAIPIAELRADHRTREGAALDDNYWRALMGLLPQFGDERRKPSPWIQPVRLGVNEHGLSGDRGFRLRFGIPLEDARLFATNEFVREVAAVGLLDADQLDLAPGAGS